MSKVAVVELAQSMTVVDGLTYYNHGCESEVVLLEDVGKVLKLSAVDPLFLPRQLVAGGNRSLGRIAAGEKLVHHLIDDACAEEDAHRGLVLRQKV